ncbi:MAG: MFS transporter [Deltaproteobacteria bacterium]|nr:MFS transporter [Deltaproteobacteria bacterium]
MLRLFSILKSKTHSIYFSGQLFSVSGSLIQLVAINWLAYELTHSVFLIGLINFVRHFPIFLFGFLTGPLLDSLNRKKVFIISLSGPVVLSLFLFFLEWNAKLSYEWLFWICLLIGCFSALETPAQRTFLSDITTERSHLSRVITYDSFQINVCRMAGPAIGGVIVASFGEAWCFLLNALFHLIGVITILCVPSTNNNGGRESNGTILSQIKEGILYVRRTPAILRTLLIIGLVSIFGIPFITITFPVYAKDILQQGPQALGYLNSAWGIGAIFGALWFASIAKPRLAKKIFWTSFLFGLSTLLFSTSNSLWFCILTVSLAAFFRMIQMIAGNTLLQTVVEEKMRGRVMAFFGMTFVGLAPIGGLLAGKLGDWVGAPTTVFIGGICCLCGAALIGWRQSSAKAPQVLTKNLSVEKTAGAD